MHLVKIISRPQRCCPHSSGFTKENTRVFYAHMPPIACAFQNTCARKGAQSTEHGSRIPFRGEAGVALLMVLWVMTILMVIVFSFSFMTRTEALSTLAFKGTIERKFIAEGGIDRGVMELFYRKAYRDQTVELEGREIWKIDGSPHTGSLGGGHYTVKITDESGKIDINSLTDDTSVIILNLLTNSGVSGEDSQIIADSILDWKDSDDLHRTSGAEDDYYMSLPNPYKAKNANFETLEELLFVKGVTTEILYGTKEKKGIINFLTLYSKTSRININAAPKEVLAAIPGITPEVADGIINYRESKEIKGTEDIQAVLGGSSSEMSKYTSTGGSNAFSIDALGAKENEKGVYGIRAIVVLADDNTHKFVYYKSPVDIKE